MDSEERPVSSHAGRYDYLANTRFRNWNFVAEVLIDADFRKKKRTHRSLKTWVNRPVPAVRTRVQSIPGGPFSAESLSTPVCGGLHVAAAQPLFIRARHNLAVRLS